MARNVLIPIIFITNWDKSERTKFLIRYNAALPRPTSSSNPDQPSVQNESGEGIPVLHIPAELLAQFDAVFEQMVDRNKQSTNSSETASQWQSKSAVICKTRSPSLACFGGDAETSFVHNV